MAILLKPIYDIEGKVVALGELAVDESAQLPGPLVFPDGTIQTTASTGGSGSGDLTDLEARVVQLETDIVNKIGQGDDAILNSVRSYTQVMADGNVIAFYEVGREYTVDATINFLDVVATATLLPEVAALGRANYEGTFYFGDPVAEIPEVPPDINPDTGEPIPDTGSPAVPAVPEGSVHTSGLVANYQYQVPGTYSIRFVPDNTASSPCSGPTLTAIARTGYTINPSIRFDVCNLSVSPSMSGVYDMGDGNTVTSDGSGNAVHSYTAGGDYTITFTPDDGNYAVTTGINIIMPTAYVITASRDDLIANMSISPDLPGYYYFGDGIPAVPEVPAVYAPHITATPDRVDNGDGTFSPGTAYAWTFTIEGGVAGEWNYGDVDSTANIDGVFTYPATGTYEVTFTRASDNQVSNLSLVVSDGDVDAQTSPDQLIADAIPEVPAVPQGEVYYDGATAVSYTYNREGTFTIRFAPDDGNDNPTTSFTAHISVPYVISSPEYFMYKALTLSPTCGGYYTMGDGIPEVPAIDATYKNRITASPEMVDDGSGNGTTIPGNPYVWSFSVENTPAGSFAYGEGTVDTAGSFTYAGAGTYAVTFTDDSTGIVSNLSLTVLDADNTVQTGDLEELTPYVPAVPAVPQGQVETTDGTAEYTYPREGDFTITFYPNELSKPVSLGVNAVQRKTYEITSSRDEMTGSFTSNYALPGTYYFGDGVPAVPEIPATYQPHITATPDRVDNGDGTFTAGTAYMWTFAIEGGVSGTWMYGDADSTSNTDGTFTYPGTGTYEVTFTQDSGAVSNLSLVVSDGDVDTQTGADQEITALVPEVPAIAEGTATSSDGTASYTYPREGTYTIRYVPDDHNYEATTTCIAHTSVPYVISSPEYFMYKTLSLSPTCGGYYNMGDYVAAIPEVPAVNKNKITATPDASDPPVPYMFTFSVENAPAGSFGYGDEAATVDTSGVFTYPGPGTYAVTFTDDATGYVSNLSLIVDDAPVAQTGELEEISPYVPEVPAIPAGEVTTTDGTAEYTYPRVGDYTITFYPNELSKPVTLDVSAVERTSYSITASRDERTATLSSSPALPGVYHFGDYVPAVPEVPAVYKKQIVATPAYDPVPLTFIFDTGVEGIYSYGDAESTTDETPNGVSEMIYTAAGDYTVTFTEASTGAVSTMTLSVPDVDPVAQTSPEEILTEAIPEVPAIEEGTLTTSDGTGTYEYAREGTFTITYIPDDHNYNATTEFISHNSVPYVISSPEYFLYKTLSLSPTCGGVYRMGDYVPEVVGVYKAHIIATPSADNSLAFTFTNDGVTRFSRIAHRLRAAKRGKSAGQYSYGDPDGTVNADGAFTYAAAGTYTVTFTDDTNGSVSTMQLEVLDSGSIEQVSDNEWLVVPEPAIPEGVIETTDGVVEYTYARAGDYTITFEPNELSKPVTLDVNAVARTDYSIVAMRDERTATLASAPALAGTYYFGDAQPAIPEVPATYGLQMTATPDYDNGQWKFNFSNNKGIGGMYAFGDEAGSSFLSADGNATFTYPAASSVTVSFMASDDTMVMITPLDIPDADPVAQSSATVELTPTIPEVPAVPEGTLTTGDGTGTYTYPLDGTFTIRYVPDDHNYEATTTFVSHTSVPYVITPTPNYLNVSLALDIPCGGTYYFGDAVAEVTDPDTGEVTTPAIPQGTLETADGTGTYAYRAAGTYTITFSPNELSKPVTADVTVEEAPPTPPDPVTMSVTSAVGMDFVFSINPPTAGRFNFPEAANSWVTVTAEESVSTPHTFEVPGGWLIQFFPANDPNGGYVWMDVMTPATSEALLVKSKYERKRK